MSQLLTTTQAAKKIGMKPRTFRWHVNEGRVATVDVGNDHLVTVEEVERFRTADKPKVGRPRKN